MEFRTQPLLVWPHFVCVHVFVCVCVCGAGVGGGGAGGGGYLINTSCFYSNMV